jgi:predicted metalloendopeptidase
MRNRPKSQVHIQYLDKSVKPSDDFFRYVKWNMVKYNRNSGDRTRWGSFDELRQRTDA